MKKMKSGFTLAEVLITLGIIGVVAAIVMPSVMTNYTYKTIGVKLAKFASQLENSARPFVVQNESLSEDDVMNNYLDEAFISVNRADLMSNNVFNAVSDGASTTGRANIVRAFTEDANGIMRLKDGTSMRVYSLTEEYEDDDVINVTQVGAPVYGVEFAPEVTGLPRAAQKRYDYVLTELGFVYPHNEDTCLTNIINASYETNARFFNDPTNAACMGGTQETPETPDDQDPPAGGGQ